MYQTDDVRVKDIQQLLPPIAVMEKYPTTENASETVYHTRTAIERILDSEDDRLLVIAGPCSIHDPKAAIEYAGKIKALRERYHDTLEIVMRVYFEKPRTTVGWKGLINDPYLDNTFNINDGLRIARKLLLDVNEMGVPAATEYLDLITPQYISDLISWGAIGARTTESQIHRELASGLSCPIGFKNSTDGTVKIALDAIKTACHSHTFLSVTKFGHAAIVTTKGNDYCHIILRGGHEPNYQKEFVDKAAQALAKDHLPLKVMIDFSHANSHKEFKRQLEVCHDVAGQISAGSRPIFGVMIESNLVEGRQDCRDPKTLVYGQSITDACVGWDDTEKCCEELSQAVTARRAAK